MNAVTRQWNKLVYYEKNLSIRGKIQLLFGVSLVFIALIAVSLIYSSSLKLQTKLQQQATSSIIKIFESQLTENLKTLNIAGLNSNLDYLIANSNVESYCLFNDQYIAVKSYNNACKLNNIPFFIPIKNKTGTIFGYFYSSEPFSNQDIIIIEIVTAFGLVAMFLLLSLVWLVRLKAVISQPLQDLSLAVTKFSESHDFHIRAPQKSNDEIGQLAAAFNRLLREMRHKEHDLIRAKNDADSANTLKGDFLASVSHEIRTPMNGIIGTAELLLESLENTKHKNYTTTILQSSENLLAIINDILDFSKIESGKLEVESIPFNIFTEIEGVADLMAIKAVEKDLEIILSISPYTPEYVIGDPSRLRQIITNLVNNAIKFTKTGHILIEVEPLGCQLDDHSISSSHNKERLRFAVVDTGIGIAESAQTKIFERFTQAQSSITRQYGGTGLGLAICKQLLDLQGGQIFLESIEGKGSTFSFQLDFLIDENQSQASANDSLEGIHVLVVDDNPYFLEYMKSSLRFFGIKITCAKNAREAISLLTNANTKAVNFDIIIIDEYMPTTNGCALAEQISLTFVDLAPPIIILNNIDSDVRHEQMYTKIGVMACMPKPIKLHRLVALMELTLTEHKEGNCNHLLSVDELSNKQKNQGIKFANPNILLCEQNNLHIMFITQLIESAGGIVEHCPTPQDTLQKASQTHYDLIILDDDTNKNCNQQLVLSQLKVIAKESALVTPIIYTHTDLLDEHNNDAKNADAIIHKHNIKNQLLIKMATLIPNYVIHAHNSFVHFENTKILLVEDNHINAQITTEILLDFGCELVHAENGRIAYDIITMATIPFDLVLMDCQMPILDGFESTRMIREFERTATNDINKEHTTIIALTANAMKGDSELCYRAGMDDYITKPIKREKLRSVLMQYINKQKIIIKNFEEISTLDAVINQELFIKAINNGKKTRINPVNYFNDISNSIHLLANSANSQPPKIVAETTQILTSLCEAFGLNLLQNTLRKLEKEALHQHAEKNEKNYDFSFHLEACFNALQKTDALISDILRSNEPVDNNKTSGHQLPVISVAEVEINPAIRLYPIKNNAVDIKKVASLDLKSSTQTDPKATPKAQSKTTPQATPKIYLASSSTPAEAPNEPWINQSCFDTAKGIFKAKFKNVLNEYSEDTHLYIENIKNGLQTNNLEKIKESAHPLKSSSYTLGFNPLGDVAKSIELAIKNQTDKNTALIFVSDNLPLLESAFVETQKALSREMEL